MLAEAILNHEDATMQRAFDDVANMEDLATVQMGSQERELATAI
jgi:hypothetical protein